jgi:hypothetical protein
MAQDLTPDYAASLGRIGGALLADNLVNFQDGGDLAFDTDLFYLDVANKKIGIYNYGTSPNELYLGGDHTLITNNAIVDTTFTNNNWTIYSNTINLSTGTMYVTPDQASNPTIVSSGIGTSNLNLTSSGFSNPTVNGNINLTPENTDSIAIVTWTAGQVNGASSLTTVTGNVGVTGNLVATKGINFGNQTTDTISFTAELTSDLNPSTDNVETLGGVGKYWNNLYATTVTVPNITAVTLQGGGIQITGNTISSVNTSNDITLSPQGTGNVSLNGIYPFSGNNIVNSTIQPYNLLSTGDGYWDFQSVTSVVFPVGTTAQRSTATLGTTRYNTDLQYLEIYNGQTWANVIGSSPPTTAATANDLGVIYDLILG